MITGPFQIFFLLLLFLVALPITLLIVLAPGLIAGWLAKRLGKSPWVWGSLIGTTFAIVISPKIPSIYFGVFSWEEKLVMPQREETVFVPLKNTHKVVIHLSVKGVNFDVPLNYMSNYMNRRYDPPTHGWQNITKGEYAGEARHKVDQFSVTALLPDLEPMSEQNYREFEKSYFGLKVQASLSHPVADDFYFGGGYFDNLSRQSDDPDVPGMMRFHDNAGGDLFYSHDHPVPDLTHITCREDKSIPSHPTCTVDTAFVYKGFYRFRLGYRFDRTYLPKWREIDHKIKTLFERLGDATP